MQNELGDTINSVRNPKPNRWVPVEVWQSKGLTAQEMTLPQGKNISSHNLLSLSMFYFRCFHSNKFG